MSTFHKMQNLFVPEPVAAPVPDPHCFPIVVLFAARFVPESSRSKASTTPSSKSSKSPKQPSYSDPSVSLNFFALPKNLLLFFV